MKIYTIGFTKKSAEQYLPFEKDKRFHKLIAAVYPVSDVSNR